MEWWQPLSGGLASAWAWPQVASVLAGATIGLWVGLLPGLGVVAALALLLPLAMLLPTAPALVMMAAVYYGAQHGGATCAIVANRAGGAASVATLTDGYQMALQGRARTALWTAGTASFVGGAMATLLLVAIALPVTHWARGFGPVESFSLLVLVLTGVVAIASGGLLQALGMTLTGLLLGMALVSAVPAAWPDEAAVLRQPGAALTLLALGLFGCGEVMARLGRPDAPTAGVLPTGAGVLSTAASVTIPAALAGPTASRRLLPRAAAAALRGGALGSLLGLLPGGGALLSATAAYALERRTVARPGEVPMGKGNVRGVAGPEAANNAGAHAALAPVLVLGLPTNAAMALLFVAFVAHDAAPGPWLPMAHAGLFWTLIASMVIGNAFLFLLNVPFVSLWKWLPAVPYRMLAPVLVLAAAAGAWSVWPSLWSLALVGAIGIAGVTLVRLGCDLVPLLMGVVLAGPFEAHLRRALIASSGEFGIFLSRPVSAALLAASALLLVLVVLPAARPTRSGGLTPDD